jgi:hypothetical protein
MLTLILSVIAAFVVGAIIGIFITGCSKTGKDYDAQMAEMLFNRQAAKLREKSDEILVRDLADKMYPEQTDFRSRIAALRFELADDECDVSGVSDLEERKRLIDVCTRIQIQAIDKDDVNVRVNKDTISILTEAQL